MKNNEKFTINLNGGIGRVICAVPALEAFVEKYPNTKIITYAPELFAANSILEDKVYSYTHKNIFEDWIKHSTFLSPEPYQNKNYYNQKIHLTQAFAEELKVDIKNYINNPRLHITKYEENIAYPAIEFAKTFKHQHTVVFQPAGVSFNPETGIDTLGRSLSMPNIEEILLYLSKHFNLIVMSDNDCFDKPEQWYTPKNFSIRDWSLIIGNSDYFIGIDSVGQHIAHSMQVPGTVILGTTFKENVTYSDWFNIIEFYTDKKYQPIRIIEEEPFVPSSVMQFPYGTLSKDLTNHLTKCSLLK